MKWSGFFISRLSGFAARCGGRDLAARRVIDEAVYDLRLEISEAATKLRISNHVEMTDEEVADQVGRADRFIEQLRDAITATVVDPASYVAGFSGSPRRWTRCLV
jgi:hypothetical protein